MFLHNSVNVACLHDETLEVDALADRQLEVVNVKVLHLDKVQRGEVVRVQGEEVHDGLRVNPNLKLVIEQRKCHLQDGSSGRRTLTLVVNI